MSGYKQAGQLALSIVLIIVGESWLLGRLTQSSVLLPFFLILPVFLGGLLYCGSTLWNLSRLRPKPQPVLIATIVPLLVVLIWGGAWAAIASPDSRASIAAVFGDDTQEWLDRNNAFVREWLDKGIEDYPDYKPPTYEELMELTDGNDFWAHAIKDAYDGGFMMRADKDEYQLIDQDWGNE